MELLTWHKTGASLDGLVRSVLNYVAWKHVFKKWLEFASDVCNVRIGLALDGVNPFGDLSLCHSTWPMVLQNYNLPLWLVTKRYFLMLALIITRKKSYTSTNVDVFLQPLIDELQTLWKGVKALDAYLGTSTTTYCAFLRRAKQKT
jgi:hypothetical protein